MHVVFYQIGLLRTSAAAPPPPPSRMAFVTHLFFEAVEKRWCQLLVGVRALHDHHNPVRRVVCNEPACMVVEYALDTGV